MKSAKTVFYNDGVDEDRYALVLKDEAVGDTLLTLGYINDDGVWSVVPGVPRREKADYGPEGGGKTWHQ